MNVDVTKVSDYVHERELVCLKACEGMDTEALTPGLVKELVEVVTNLIGEQTANELLERLKRGGGERSNDRNTENQWADCKRNTTGIKAQ